MIVRILGEGQYRLTDDHIDELNQLDGVLERAIEAADVPTFETALRALLTSVREHGQPVDDDELVGSDNVLPYADATIDEVAELLGDEGLIPG